MIQSAFLFPGQGAQSVGMMSAWKDHQPIVQEVYAQASEVLDYDLWKYVSTGPESELNRTEVTQPAMLCAGVASWKIVQKTLEFIEPVALAGHSLGEYTALVCARSIDFSSAVDLVAKRGTLMQSATNEGLMAAIIGLSDEAVHQACGQVDCGIVEAANYNAPGQVVISGNQAAVEKAMKNAKSLGAKRILPLAVGVPSHCALMQDAADQLLEVLEGIEIKQPQIPVIQNQNADVGQSVEDIRDLLQKQLYQPVRWVETIRKMHTQGIKQFIECGPGGVLSGLVRRIEKSMRGRAISDHASLEKARQSLRSTHPLGAN